MTAGAAAAGVVRREHLIADAFRKAGAVSPDRASTSAALGVDEGMAFRILCRQGQLREVERGRFYLDEPSWRALAERRRQIGQTILAVLGLSILGVLIIIWLIQT